MAKPINVIDDDFDLLSYRIDGKNNVWLVLDKYRKSYEDKRDVAVGICLPESQIETLEKLVIEYNGQYRHGYVPPTYAQLKANRENNPFFNLSK